MEKLFLTVLNLSVTGSYAILAVLAARLLLARAPKKWRYLLWSVAAFRLAIPVSFSGWFSLFNLTTAKAAGARMEYIPADIGYQAAPTVELGTTALNRVVNGSLPAATPMTSMNPMQFWLWLGQWLWVVGMGALLLYNLAALLWLRHSLNAAAHRRDNIWVGDCVPQPFVLGWLRPRIYLPTGMDPAAEEVVLAHERYHIRRGDHWVKLLGFCLLVVHWFNPLCWLAFRLMTRDMEMSCDEGVLAKQPVSPKTYSSTLLSLAAIGRKPLPGALHFGESDISSRIKNSLRWKQPGWWVTGITAAAAAVVILTVAANPLAHAAPQSQLRSGRYVMDSDVLVPPILVLDGEGRFEYPYSAFLSSFPEGSCTQEGTHLTCTTDDGQYVLQFEIMDETTLVYRAEGSVPPKILSEPLDAAVEEGAVFRWQEDFPPLTEPETEKPSQTEGALPVELPESGALPQLLGCPLGEGYTHISLRYTPEYHRGTDFCAAAGTPVYAVADGTVVISDFHYSYGNYVKLVHAQPYQEQEASSMYCHMSELAVVAGETVGQGDLLGYVGCTGAATGNHLHLELRLDGQLVDPAEYVVMPNISDPVEGEGEAE